LRIFFRFVFLKTLIVLIISLFTSGCGELFQMFRHNELSLVSPEDGMKITNNIPTLAWSRITCDKYEIWLDGTNIDSVVSGNNFYVPFPLSSGKHIWSVIAFNNGQRIPSDSYEFYIEDKPLEKVPENSLILRNNWKIQSSIIATDDGTKISSPAFETKGWYTTSLPATVLTALVRNNVYANPYTGMNNRLIPDMNDIFNNRFDMLKYSYIPNQNPWKKPYWFRTEFGYPDNFPGKRIWLNFGEINYRASVWLNGKIIADTSIMVGMDRAFKFDVTSFLNKDEKNILAVEIYPPDHPGLPAPEPVTALADPGRNLGQDGWITRDYTKWDVLGWDWQPAIRDRDMGIPRDVFLSSSDDVELESPYVTSDLNLKDTSYADLTISADIVNHSNTSKDVKILVSIEKDDKEIITVEYNLQLASNETKTILLDRNNFSQLHLQNPKLWWPSGYGSPELYSLSMKIKTSEGTSSYQKVNFGIRKVETYVSGEERIYKINGEIIYMKGGNWVQDMMLNWNSKRFEQEIRLTKNANLNFLRIWGPTGTPPEALYNAADKYGILLWQDFLNDFWGSERNNPDYKPQEKLYTEATTEIVKKFRNHPSLIIWCGGNEGPNPRQDIIMNQILPMFDGRDTKHYLKSSDGEGIHGGGPYNTISPEKYYNNNKINGFSSEIGPSGVPEYESLIKFLNNPGKNYKEGYFPLNGEWAYHNATDRPEDSRKFSTYDTLVKKQYGSIDSLNLTGFKEYADKAQLLNYEVYRSVIESLNRQLWNTASGFGLWKSNSSWPSVVWQLYDWYLDPNAGYYGTKSACEPLHVQMNLDDRKVIIWNSLYENKQNTTVSATLYNMKMKEIWHGTDTLNLFMNRVATSRLIIPVQDSLSFLKLINYDENGNVLSENFYWLNKNNDYTGLKSLPSPDLSAEATKKNSHGQTKFTVTIANRGNTLAFMTNLKIKDKVSGQETLPTYWSDNYFSLLPGESKEVTAEYDNDDASGWPVIECKAYNMQKPIIINP